MTQHVTAAELKTVIEARLNALDDVLEDGEQLFANEISWHAADESGCNWTMESYRGARNYASSVSMAIHKLRREYRLGEDALQYSANGSEC